MSIVYLGLGTNLGDKRSNITNAIELIKEWIGQATGLSTIYSSEPWGFKSDNQFYNAVIRVETTLSPLELLEKTQLIEQKVGRSTKSINHIYTDRIIDIDILLYDNQVINIENKLEVPHPEMLNRDFVLIPLAEIDSELIHPITHLKIENYIRDKQTLDKLK